MTGFSVSLDTGKQYLKNADGTQNPYSTVQSKEDGIATSAEIGVRLVELQNNPANNQTEGSLWQTIMNGNDGKGYYDLIAKLDGEAGISDKDLQKLAGYGRNSDTYNNINQIDQNDFLALKESSNTSPNTNVQNYQPDQYQPIETVVSPQNNQNSNGNMMQNNFMLQLKQMFSFILSLFASCFGLNQDMLNNIMNLSSYYNNSGSNSSMSYAYAQPIQFVSNSFIG